MFHFFRKNIKLFIWIIVLSFVIWGAGSSITAFRGESTGTVGKVGKENISQKEFLMMFRFYELLSQAQSAEAKAQASEPAQSSSDKPPAPGNQKTEPAKTDVPRPDTGVPSPPSYEEIKGVSWQTIILNREAKKRGIRVTDKEVADEIRKQFSDPGNYFNQEMYGSWVRRNFRGEPREFEEAFRKHMVIQKIREQILTGVPDADREKRWLEFLIPVISNAKWTEEAAPSES